MMKAKKAPKPPKWADRFLEFYCNPNLLEQIQGDVHELFYYRLEEHNAARAKRAFVFDVIRFFKWRNIKRSRPSYYHNNSIDMFKNYLKIGWRNLIKQRGTSTINIFGLAVAVACCIVAYLLVESVWFKGMYHDNKEDIYLLTHTKEKHKEAIKYGVVSSPIAEIAIQELPAIQYTTRINTGNYVITHQNESFSERSMFVDPDFMDMFTYKIQAGYGGALNEPHSVIITHSAAQKFFGGAHPIGQEIGIVIKGKKEIFVVGGVMEDLPATALFKFEVLVNNQHYYSAAAKLPTEEQWKDHSWVFVQLETGITLEALQAGLQSILSKQQEIMPKQQYSELQLTPFANLITQAKQIESGPVNFGSMGPQILLIAIALFMLTLAIFNYVNISVLMASKRLKEIGIRKVIGGRKSQLVFQFLSENLIMCFLALILGAIFATTLLLPWFNGMASKNLQLDLLHNLNIWLFLTALLILVALISGSYPAFYISSFKPVAIFSGKMKIGKKNAFTGGLLTFQFTLAIITIVAGTAFVQTNHANETRDWGYDKQSKIVVNVPTEQDYLVLRDAYNQEANITAMAGSQDKIGHGLEEKLINYREKEYQVDLLRGAANYPELMGLRLKAGRFFNPELTTDIETGILVNQSFMKKLDLSFPVAELVTIAENQYKVLGVVEDFHSHFFTFSIDPVVIMGIPEANFNYLSLQLTANSEQQMADRIRRIWHDQIETGFYEGELQSAVFDDYFEDLNGVSNMLIYTSILAIMLSAMGLFGLVSLNINARMKDISIRKIMGATIVQIAQKIFKPYLIFWAIACLFGCVLAAMVINLMLDSLFAFHAGVGFFTIGLAVIVLLLVIAITVGTQIWKVQRNNPADTLKSE